MKKSLESIALWMTSQNLGTTEEPKVYPVQRKYTQVKLTDQVVTALILDPDLECHLLTFNRLLVVFCHILSATGE